MSMPSEHKGNGSPTETSVQLKGTKEQIDGVLQLFDVLTSKFDRFVFKYIYIYLIGLLFLGELLLIPYRISPPQAGKGLLALGVIVLPMVIIISIIWSFNVWRSRTPKMLRDLLEKGRICHPDGDVNTYYLRFLENYRDALGSPKRYFLGGFLMIFCSGMSVYRIVYLLSGLHLNIFAMILFMVGGLLFMLSYLGGLYCIGIVTWAQYISGSYVRKLLRAFELRIHPFHTDNCGGLHMVGNFYFGLVSPTLIGSGLLIGYIFLYFIISVSTSGNSIDAPSLVMFVGLPLLFLLLNGFLVIVSAFILPLRDIHIKMVSEQETDEDIYNAHIEALREEIQSLLANDKVEEAKALQEKKAIVEILHIPYPTWPFSLRSKIFSTVLRASGSLLIGIVTAALPVLLSLIFTGKVPNR